MSCCMTDSCIVISSIILEEAVISGQGGPEMAVCSLSVYMRVSTVALRAAVSILAVL
jgi:hypothetical protein